MNCGIEIFIRGVPCVIVYRNELHAKVIGVSIRMSQILHASKYCQICNTAEIDVYSIATLPTTYTYFHHQVHLQAHNTPLS